MHIILQFIYNQISSIKEESRFWFFKTILVQTVKVESCVFFSILNLQDTILRNFHQFQCCDWLSNWGLPCVTQCLLIWRSLPSEPLCSSYRSAKPHPTGLSWQTRTTHQFPLLQTYLVSTCLCVLWY